LIADAKMAHCNQRNAPLNWYILAQQLNPGPTLRLDETTHAQIQTKALGSSSFSLIALASAGSVDHGIMTINLTAWAIRGSVRLIAMPMPRTKASALLVAVDQG